MKTLALLLAAAAVIGAMPAFAEESLPSQDSAASALALQAGTAPERTGPPNLCSKEDPYIEYRDCVNASTRDSNAKVRDA